MREYCPRILDGLSQGPRYSGSLMSYRWSWKRQAGSLWEWPPMGRNLVCPIHHNPSPARIGLYHSSEISVPAMLRAFRGFPFVREASHLEMNEVLVLSPQTIAQITRSCMTFIVLTVFALCTNVLLAPFLGVAANGFPFLLPCTFASHIILHFVSWHHVLCIGFPLVQIAAETKDGESVEQAADASTRCLDACLRRTTATVCAGLALITC